MPFSGPSSVTTPIKPRHNKEQIVHQIIEAEKQTEKNVECRMCGAVDADGGDGGDERRDRRHDRAAQAGAEPGDEPAGPHHFQADAGHCIPWPHCLLQGKVSSLLLSKAKAKTDHHGDKSSC